MPTRPIRYRGGVIQLEIEPIIQDILGIYKKKSISIISLGQEDIIVSYNQLKEYNPNVNQVNRIVIPRDRDSN